MMLDQYFEIEAKRCGHFFGLVVGTALIVTVIYWAIFGFDRWEAQVQRASDLMMAASIVPVAPVAAAPTGPATSGQYVCPRDGAVGLPNFDAAGVPHCPVCGQGMGFCGAPSNSLTLAARGAG